MIPQRISAFAVGGAAISCAAVILFAFAAPVLPAQTTPTISVQVLDGKTGQPLSPSNILVHVDHHDAIHQDWVKLNDDGTIMITPAPTASLLGLQGTYNASMMIYINCDAGEDANTDKLYWYPIADILAKGVVAPNRCYKGIYQNKFAVTPKPGEFIFFVRERDRHDTSAF
jgi:hypothetical protein